MQERMRRLRRIALWLLLGAALFWLRKWLWQGFCQVLLGAGAAALALPLDRRFEKTMQPGAAAALAMAASGAVLAVVLLLVVPPMLSQLRAFFYMLPELLQSAGEMLLQGKEWLQNHGIPMDERMNGLLMEKGQSLLTGAAPVVARWVGSVAGGIGQWMLTPIIAFYFLRDRRRISQRLWLLLPAGRRRTVRRALSEMKREVAGYLRGQLLISAAVGGLTAVGLLFCGVEAWFALGLVMGILELIPYAGPFLGGALAVLFALPGGFSRVLWTLGVVIAVQQAEGSLLSPRLLSAATQLHPLSVILCITLGRAAAGVWGMLLSVPLLLCARAAIRVAGEARQMETSHR